VTVSPSSNRTHAYGSCGSELQSITVVYSRDQSVRLSVTFNFTMYGDSTYQMDSFSLEAVINGQMIDGWWILPIFKHYKLLIVPMYHVTICAFCPHRHLLINSDSTPSSGRQTV